MEASENRVVSFRMRVSTALRCGWGVRLGASVLIALYVTTWGVAVWLPATPSDLELFFLPSARIALAGHPLSVYVVRNQLGYPNANGPLSLLPLTAVAALAAHLGWLDDFALSRMLIMAAFSVFSLLMAWEAVAAIDRLRGVPLRGVVRVLAFAAFAGAPGVWRSVLIYGHVEQPLALWLVLWAVRMLTEQRPGRAGVLLGLALLTRTTSLVYLVPLTLVVFAARQTTGTFRLLVMTCITTAVGLLPFAVADSHDLIYSLLTFRGALPVGGGTLWELAVGTPYLALAQHDDAVFVLVGAFVASGLVLLRRADLDVRSPDLYGVLALASLSFLLFTKTLWPYYSLDLYLMIAIWTLGQPQLWRVPRLRPLLLLPVGCAALAFAPVINIWAIPDYHTLRDQSLVMSALLGGLALGLGTWLALMRQPVSASCAGDRDVKPRPEPG